MLLFRILTFTGIILLPDLLSAQTTPLDTTMTSGDRIIHFSTKEIGGSSLMLMATEKNKTMLRDTIEGYGLADITFPDFNKDGYVDILLVHFGNNTYYILYLFDPMKNQFREIERYGSFPDAVQLTSNKRYYYSYHKAGCADMNWVSDLFKIVNFKIIHLGSISGRGCDNAIAEQPPVINIYKISGNDERNRKLVTTLPYLKFIPEFADKWDFIEEYWNKNYRKFETKAVKK